MLRLVAQSNSLFCQDVVLWIRILLCFFFFQAEDGIRDLTVTGVQTCALPIWFLRVRHHISEADYNSLLQKQGGKCTACRLSSPKHLHVDHDHSCCKGVTSCGDRKSVV